MITQVRTFVITKEEPEDKYVGWFKPLTDGSYALYFYNRGEWIPLESPNDIILEQKVSEVADIAANNESILMEHYSNIILKTVGKSVIERGVFNEITIHWKYKYSREKKVKSARLYRNGDLVKVWNGVNYGTYEDNPRSKSDYRLVIKVDDLILEKTITVPCYDKTYWGLSNEVRNGDVSTLNENTDPKNISFCVNPDGEKRFWYCVPSYIGIAELLADGIEIPTSHKDMTVKGVPYRCYYSSNPIDPNVGRITISEVSRDQWAAWIHNVNLRLDSLEGIKADRDSTRWNIIDTYDEMVNWIREYMEVGMVFYVKEKQSVFILTNKGLHKEDDSYMQINDSTLVWKGID